MFTRTPSGMRPTASSLTIAPQIQAALEQIDRALASRSFDPATSSRTFSMGANDYVQFVVLPRLIARLNRVAPQVRLVARGFGDLLPLDPLERGEFDVVIGLFDRVPAALAARGMSRRVMYSIQQFLVAALVVAESELLVTTAERVARMVARLSSLRVAELPLKLPGFDLKQVSHARSSEDAGIVWLRAEIMKIARRLAPLRVVPATERELILAGTEN